MIQMNTDKTILLVDDDTDFLRQHEMQLTAAGFKVVTAEDSKSAMEIVNQSRPDLAIVDIMMEHMDEGFTLCYQLKKKDSTMPVIVVTGVTSRTGMEFDASTKEERSWVKADAMLAKPVRFEQLLREISRLV